MSFKLPRIIAHRGASAYAPENTLDAFHTAADMGIEWVEFDVKLTKDGVPIVFHDDTLERTTNGHGNVADFTLNELQELDAGHWYADSFTGVHIPTLEEVLEVLDQYNMGFNMEIKPCAGREIETTEAALDLTSRIWDEHNKIIISSFVPACIECAMEMAPEWRRGLLLPKDMEDSWQTLAEHLNPVAIHVKAEHTERQMIEDMIDAEYAVLAYTVNDPQLCRQLQGWGVDGFFSDAPDVIKDSLLTVH